jgi:Calcium-dependent channel, 7TM region, putative phosphate
MTNLQPLLRRRKICIRNLEHALAKAESKQNLSQSWYNSQIFFSIFSHLNQKENLNAIDILKEELNMLNKDINDLINIIERKQRPAFMGGKQKGSRTLTQGMNSSSANCSFVDFFEDDSENILSRVSEHTPEASLRCRRTVDMDQRDASGSRRGLTIMNSPSLMHTKSAFKQKAVQGITQVREKVKVTNEILISFITNEEDGTADDAAFVTFKSLIATYCALQMSQHREPFILETTPAPDNPQHIFWNNVGKPKELLQMGRYLSCGITVVICVFWTGVVTLIVGVANVDYLKGNPWLDWIRVLISPLILLLFNSGLLPIILKAVSRLECPASDSLLETSAFWKMTAFTIIQTFL